MGLLRTLPSPAPLRVVALALVTGAIAGSTIPTAAVAATLVACAVTALWTRRGTATARPRLLRAVAAVALLTGVVRGAAGVPPPAPEGFRETPVILTGTLETAPRVQRDAAGGRDALLRLRLDPGGRAAVLRVRLLRGEEPPRVEPGDRVRVTGRATAPRPPTNPGERDRRAALRREGVVLHVHVPSSGALRVVAAGPPSPLQAVRRLGARARAGLLGRLAGAVGDRPRTFAILSALLVGDRSGLEEDVEEGFRHAGAAHLLAVSGLHVVLLVGGVAALLEVLRRLLAPGRRGRDAVLVLTLAFVAAYAAVCGLATPVVRASVFVAVAVVARRLGRRTRTPDHLAAAAALVVAFDPAQALAPGFHLSFAAVLGLCLLTQRFREALFSTWDLLARFPEAFPAWRLRLQAWLAAGTSASLAASTATAPVSALVFGEVHPAGPLSNLLAVPLVGLLLPAAAAAALLGAPVEPVAGPLLELGVAALSGLLTGIAALPGATLATGTPPAWAAAAAFAALVAGAARVPWRRRHLLLPGVAWMLLVAVPGGREAAAPPATPSIVALDVGHGVAVLLRGGSGGAVLYDAGGRMPGTAERIVVPALRRLGVTRLAAVAVSHEDIDHCGAVPEVLAALPVGVVLVPAGFGGASAGRRVLRACARQSVPVVHLGRGDRWDLRDVRLLTLHPRARAPGPAENEGSLVLHADLGTRDALRLSALLTGDVEGTTLETLARDPTVPAADLLLLPHHGRGPPEPQALLAARCGARRLVASTPVTAPTSVAGALVTGRTGALLFLPGRAPIRLMPAP